jgi:predicted TIM-barrel fold metal-dependent hydrolase
MTADGVDVAVLYPTYGIELAFASDADVQIAGMRAYNEMAWQWARDGDPGRLVPLALVPAVGVDVATAELARVAATGFKGIVFTGWPSGARDPAPEDDRFWAACAEAGIVVSLLGGGPAGNRTPAAPRRYVAEGATHVRVVDLPQEMRWTQQAATNNVDLTWLVLTGVLDRFPALTLVLADAGAGWLPTCGELLDWNYRYAQFVAFAKLRLRPSDYIRRQVRATLRDERSAVESRGDIGVRSMLWSTGYPTSTSTWPVSAQSRAELFAGVDADEVAAIVGGNAAELYGLHRDAAVSV